MLFEGMKNMFCQYKKSPFDRKRAMKYLSESKIDGQEWVVEGGGEERRFIVTL